MQHQYSAQMENILLRPLQEKDIEKLREWRNNAHNTVFLRKIPTITSEMQKQWYQTYLKDESCITFAIEETQELNCVVGSICLYDLDEKQCEWGRFMVGETAAHGKGIGLKALLLCMHIGFDKLHMERIYASVHENNLAARKVDDKAGFEIYGTHPFFDGGNELEIELTKERFYNLHPDMKTL